MLRLLRRPGARALGLVALAFALPTLTAATSTAASSAAAPAGPPITLWAPGQVVAYDYGGEVWTDFGLRVIAEDAPFELWSTRPSYDDPIRTVWRSPHGDVALPDGSMRDFSGMSGFLSLTVTSRRTGETRTMHESACLGAWSERVRPDAQATSPYPRSCWYNPYSLGSVQGVQEGWATPIAQPEHPLHLTRGRYDITARITDRYASVLGLTADQASRAFTLVVKRESDSERPVPVRGSTARPAAHEPRQASSGAAPTRPVPDLRPLPAWGIRVSGNGDFLQFSATVWNGGDSPLVVDGFRRDGEDEMDAYQYFFDGNGDQTGYQKVGQMHWDARRTHQHWHFEDFARYTLVRKNPDGSVQEVVRSKKEAFCLANTDAVDQTVPNAVWNPENTDLSTSCGDHNSLSIREVLASGWGDTYAQFRAGQSFRLEDVPNGTYYVAVTANPDGRLVEASTDNNVSYRKVVIGGKAGARTVKVPQVGLIEEPDFSGK